MDSINGTRRNQLSPTIRRARELLRQAFEKTARWQKGLKDLLPTDVNLNGSNQRTCHSKSPREVSSNWES